MTGAVVVLVTAPDLEVARKLAQAALEAKAAACANLIPAVESHYWWEGKLETSSEVLIIFKTRSEKTAELEKVVKANHPYQVPEFVVLGIESGSAQYLQWIGDSLR